MKEIDWNELRKKAWHIALMLGSAYLATNPKTAWAVPVLTGAAGFSQPPAGLTRAGAAAFVLVAAGLGVAVQVLLVT